MSADTQRKAYRYTCNMIRPQIYSERSLIESVVDFFSDVVPQAYSGTPKVEDKEKIQWVRFETCDVSDIAKNPDLFKSDTKGLPLLLVLGYSNGVQLWHITPNGEAQEILSIRQGPVRILRILPNPDPVLGYQDTYASKRPLAVMCDSSSAGQPYCGVKFVSLKTGDEVHSVSFKTLPIHNIECNKRFIVIVFLEKMCVYEACAFKQLFWVTSCFPCPGPNVNPVALSTRWLAYADKRLVAMHQSCGGMSGDGSQSYAATVISAAKGAIKGLSMFGEAMVSSISGCKPSSGKKEHLHLDNGNRPGIVSVVDIQHVHNDHFNVNEDNEGDGLIAHFHAHANEPVSYMAFDPTGTLLVTACKLGHNFHVFRLMAHPCSSSLGAVHHLYTLYRGDTTAKVIDISFNHDSRWVTVSTHRGTTHLFPITTYGGPVNVRTHCQPHVVNRASRFHRSAGLEEIEHSPLGRRSPVLSTSPSSSGQYDRYPTLIQQNTLNNNMGNPRLPPYPHPITVSPAFQIKQPLNVVLNPANKNQSPNHSPTGLDNVYCVCSRFCTPRLCVVGSPKLDVERREGGKRPVESLFVMAQSGTLVEYVLEPRARLPSDKITDDTNLDLTVVGRMQWNLQRMKTSVELRPPLASNCPLILAHEAVSSQVPTAPELYDMPGLTRQDSKDSLSSDHSGKDDSDEQWLSQVEIITHAGPHRRLWMGPQFSFKTYQENTTVLSSNSSALLSHQQESNMVAMDITGEEGDLESLKLQPTRSNPVTMPTARPAYRRSSGSDSSLGFGGIGAPLMIEAGSFEQSPHLLDVYSNWTESTVAKQPRGSDDLEEDRIKETLADAMVESPIKDIEKLALKQDVSGSTVARGKAEIVDKRQERRRGVNKESPVVAGRSDGKKTVVDVAKHRPSTVDKSKPVQAKVAPKSKIVKQLIPDQSEMVREPDSISKSAKASKSNQDIVKDSSKSKKETECCQLKNEKESLGNLQLNESKVAKEKSVEIIKEASSQNIVEKDIDGKNNKSRNIENSGQNMQGSRAEKKRSKEMVHEKSPDKKMKDDINEIAENKVKNVKESKKKKNGKSQTSNQKKDQVKTVEPPPCDGENAKEKSLDAKQTDGRTPDSKDDDDVEIVEEITESKTVHEKSSSPEKFDQKLDRQEKSSKSNSEISEQDTKHISKEQPPYNSKSVGKKGRNSQQMPPKTDVEKEDPVKDHKEEIKVSLETLEDTAEDSILDKKATKTIKSDRKETKSIDENFAEKTELNKLSTDIKEIMKEKSPENTEEIKEESSAENCVTDEAEEIVEEQENKSDMREMKPCEERLADKIEPPQLEAEQLSQSETQKEEEEEVFIFKQKKKGKKNKKKETENGVVSSNVPQNDSKSKDNYIVPIQEDEISIEPKIDTPEVENSDCVVTLQPEEPGSRKEEEVTNQPDEEHQSGEAENKSVNVKKEEEEPRKAEEPSIQSTSENKPKMPSTYEDNNGGFEVKSKKKKKKKKNGMEESQVLVTKEESPESEIADTNGNNNSSRIVQPAVASNVEIEEKVDVLPETVTETTVEPYCIEKKEEKHQVAEVEDAKDDGFVVKSKKKNKKINNMEKSQVLPVLEKKESPVDTSNKTSTEEKEILIMENDIADKEVGKNANEANIEAEVIRSNDCTNQSKISSAKEGVSSKMEESIDVIDDGDPECNVSKELDTDGPKATKLQTEIETEVNGAVLELSETGKNETSEAASEIKEDVRKELNRPEEALAMEVSVYMDAVPDTPSRSSEEREGTSNGLEGPSHRSEEKERLPCKPTVEPKSGSKSRKKKKNRK